MDDQEMTKLCAEAMGFGERYKGAGLWAYEWHDNGPEYFAPLDNDAHAMALVKKLRLCVDQEASPTGLRTVSFPGPMYYSACNADLNRAIVECVAKMQKAKQP